MVRTHQTSYSVILLRLCIYAVCHYTYAHIVVLANSDLFLSFILFTNKEKQSFLYHVLNCYISTSSLTFSLQTLIYYYHYSLWCSNCPRLGYLELFLIDFNILSTWPHYFLSNSLLSDSTEALGSSLYFSSVSVTLKQVTTFKKKFTFFYWACLIGSQ